MDMDMDMGLGLGLGLGLQTPSRRRFGEVSPGRVFSRRVFSRLGADQRIALIGRRWKQIEKVCG